MQNKRELNSKIHLAVDANGLPVRIFVTAGTTADCTYAGKLIAGISAAPLLADHGYDTNELLELATTAGMPTQSAPTLLQDMTQFIA